MKAFTVVLLSLALAACSTSQRIARPDGSSEFLIQCGASTGWDICYSKANEVCPTGYADLDKDAGFNRKTLRINCPAK